MMTEPEVRKQVVSDIEYAVQCGARKSAACKMVGIAATTLRRWKPTDAEEVLSDLRLTATRPPSSNRLSSAEREHIVEVANQPEYGSLPPSQIVPMLADQGVYIASEWSFYRVLKSVDQVHARGRANKRQQHILTTHVAHEPNEVWTWDITYLPSWVKGEYYYLYMMQDLFGRMAVHWDVHDRESGELASQLIAQAVLKCCKKGERPILHSDNGKPMTAFTMRAKMLELGIKPSHQGNGIEVKIKRFWSNEQSFIRPRKTVILSAGLEVQETGSLLEAWN